ncbi:NADP-dependent oxidoreductase [Nonomuraea sp. NPDC049695]|uniref:NADP-dependent oxidoreductase n=1 Tax=Nonomuraea sp. NPDC049695 TaxID=3154734 RepID=UPI00344923EC
MSTRMLAVSQRAFGGPQVLEIIETERPEPGPHEVLVRIKAAGVNPADWKIRSGQIRRLGQPPFTLGLDLSGVVEAVGEAVTRLRAAAGGIGHLAVQIAKARGAYVIGTARADKHAFLHRLGADELIDYTRADFATVARDIDVVLDPIAEDYGPRSLDTLAPGGILIDVRGAGPDRSDVRKLADERGLRFVEFGFTPSTADLEAIAGLVRQGALRAAVETVLPLAQAARAHELSETGRVKGKIVLTVNEAV